MTFIKMKRFAVIHGDRKTLYPKSTNHSCDDCEEPIYVVQTYLYDMFTGRRFHHPRCTPKRIGWGRDGRGEKIDARRKY